MDLSKNYKWYTIVNRPRCPFINSIMIDGMTHFYKKDHPIDYSLKNFVYINGYWYGDEIYEDKKRNEIVKRLSEDNRFLLKIMSLAYIEWNTFEKFCKIIKNKNLKVLSYKKIKLYFNKTCKFLLEWNGRFLQFMWLPEKTYENKIKDLLEKKMSNYSKEDFLLLTSPKKEGFFEEENRKFLILVKKIQSKDDYVQIFKKDNMNIEKELLKNKNLHDLLYNHLEEFSWLANSSFKSTFWNIYDIIQRIKDTINHNTRLKIEELDVIRKEREEKIKNFVIKLNLNKSEIIDIETVRELVYFRTFRTDIQWKSGYYLYPLFHEIASRIGISVEDFHYLTFFDIQNFLDKGTLDKEIITKRKYRYAMIAENNEVKYYYDEEKINELKNIVEAKEEINIKELKGSMASPGIATGEVKIIHSVKDLSKIKVGDILITSMTKPDYIVAMEKASAFVTDEGGILCHAAIIAREMNKPCIIGTEKATKIFKDGDLVEVNANKGIVKKIE